MKKIVSLLIAMVILLSLVPKPATAGDVCEDYFCVEDIELSYKVLPNGKYSYIGEVKVVENAMQPVRGATVTSSISIMYPGSIGYLDDLTAVTNPKGLAVYRVVKPAGTFFALCVLKIEKDGIVVQIPEGDVCEHIYIP